MVGEVAAASIMGWSKMGCRIEESINLSREEVQTSIKTSREIDPVGVDDRDD